MITNVPIEPEGGPGTPPKAYPVPAHSDTDLAVLERKFIEFLETGELPLGLFSEDVFVDFTPPLWRLQASGVHDALALRRAGHPCPGRVLRWPTDRTDRVFVMAFDETWADAGQQWYCREMARADVAHGVVTALSVYCTGDWDAARQARHARQEVLLRP